MIDVFNEIKPLLNFKTEDDFYYLQILQRKKENPQLGSNSRVIKNYYIDSIEYLEERYNEIKSLCHQFNARAMLRLNKRSYRKVAFKTMQNIANSMANGNYLSIKKSYDRACGDGHNDKHKKYILDIDGEFDNMWLCSLIEHINNIEPKGDKIIIQLKTKNGIHLITKPFRVDILNESYFNVDIHKDNPINLYIP